MATASPPAARRVGARHRRSFLVTALVACAASGAAAQSRDSAAAALALLRDYTTAQHVPGASAAVMVDGRIVWSAAVGLADLEQRVEATTATRFRVGSISKSLTSVALAQLYEAGKLDLDAPVQRYAPTFPEKEYPITPRQLGTHVSGLPHYTAADMVNRVRYASVTDALRKFQDRPLLFRPGEQFRYSSDVWAGGGFLSTAEDLVRFGDGVLAGPVVGAAGRALLFAPARTSDGRELDYGFGWSLGTLDGLKTVGHGGSHIGATAELLVVPERRLSVAILTNSNNRGIEVLAQGIARLWLGPTARRDE